MSVEMYETQALAKKSPTENFEKITIKRNVAGKTRAERASRSSHRWAKHKNLKKRIHWTPSKRQIDHNFFEKSLILLPNYVGFFPKFLSKAFLLLAYTAYIIKEFSFLR